MVKGRVIGIESTKLENQDQIITVILTIKLLDTVNII